MGAKQFKDTHAVQVNNQMKQNRFEINAIYPAPSASCWFLHKCPCSLSLRHVRCDGFGWTVVRHFIQKKKAVRYSQILGQFWSWMGRMGCGNGITQSPQLLQLLLLSSQTAVAILSTLCSALAWMAPDLGCPMTSNTQDSGPPPPSSDYPNHMTARC